jgi:nicotinamidase-related amidase
MEASMQLFVHLLKGRPFIVFGGFVVLAVCCGVGWAGESKNIVELWNDVKAPEPVALSNVKLDPATTAFLVLDIEQLTCNEERRPRCVASVPSIGVFLERARSKGVFIAYSLTPKGMPESILAGVKPVAKEPMVNSSVDKFFGTELETILRQHKIENVIIIGTAAEGAVLHTANGAAVRGFKVVVPVDGMTSGALYAEQYTAWHLLNAPGTKGKVILTTFKMIEL